MKWKNALENVKQLEKEEIIGLIEERGKIEKRKMGYEEKTKQNCGKINS